MAKPIRSQRKKSNGKLSPSTNEVRYVISGTKGETDGTKVSIGISGTKPGFNRRKPRTKSGRDSKLTRADITALPSDALVAMDGANQAVIALYDVQPDTVAEVVRMLRSRL